MSEIKPLSMHADKILDRAIIETPCPTSWDQMKGNDSVRFCGMCSLNVYNISAMTDKEAEAILARGASGERVCARLYRRPDGTVMTDNCPRGLRKIRNASRWMHAKIVACFGLLLSLASPVQAQQTTAANDKPGNAQCETDKKNAKLKNLPMPMMGAVAVPRDAKNTPKVMPTPVVEMGEIAPPVKSDDANAGDKKAGDKKSGNQKSDSKKPAGKKADFKDQKHAGSKEAVDPNYGMIQGRIRIEPQTAPSSKPAESK